MKEMNGKNISLRITKNNVQTLNEVYTWDEFKDTFSECLVVNFECGATRIIFETLNSTKEYVLLNTK